MFWLLRARYYFSSLDFIIVQFAWSDLACWFLILFQHFTPFMNLI